MQLVCSLIFIFLPSPFHVMVTVSSAPSTTTSSVTIAFSGKSRVILYRFDLFFQVRLNGKSTRYQRFLLLIKTMIWSGFSDPFVFRYDATMSNEMPESPLSPSFLQKYNMSMSSQGCEALFCLWLFCPLVHFWSSSVAYFKNVPEYLKKGNSLGVNPFNVIPAAEFN